MPLLDRQTLVDRPTIVDRGNEEDEQDNQETEGNTVEVLGSGGGPVVNNLEFEPGDFDLVSGANAAAVLATGEQNGEAFESAFTNAAVQLKDLQKEGRDITDISRFSLENGVSDIGLTESDIEVLTRGAGEEQENTENDSDSNDSSSDESSSDEEESSEEESESDDSDSEDSEQSEDSDGVDISGIEEDLEDVKDSDSEESDSEDGE